MARRSVRVTDAQWAKIEPHLPRPRRSSTGGRPRVSHRDVVDGILWVLKTGARWRDLPEGYPSGSTCWRRLRQWDEDGTWLRMWRSFHGLEGMSRGPEFRLVARTGFKTFAGR